MEKMNRNKEKEVSSDRTQKVFTIIGKKESLQNLVNEASSTFSTSVTAKALSNYERQAELIRDKMTVQSRCLTRLL